MMYVARLRKIALRTWDCSSNLKGTKIMDPDLAVQQKGCVKSAIQTVRFLKPVIPSLLKLVLLTKGLFCMNSRIVATIQKACLAFHDFRQIIIFRPTTFKTRPKGQFPPKKV